MENNQQTQSKKKRAKVPFILFFYRFIFSRIGAVFPNLIGRLAYRFWFMTQHSPRPKREEGWLRTVSRIGVMDIDNSEIKPKGKTISVKNLKVSTYYWENPNGENAPLVLLVHGWAGRGSQMGAFAEPLLKAGFRVLALDNHAHGETQGNASTIFIQSDVQQALNKKVGPFYAIVTHSFGGMVTPFSLSQGMETQKIVCISAPSRFDYLLESFCRTLRVHDKVRENIIKRFKAEFGDDLAERVSSTTTSQKLGHIKALIIHDEDDHDVPISESELLHKAWPNSIMKRTSGLGHRRILYNEQVVNDTVAFLK